MGTTDELVALRAFFDAWWNRISTYDPGQTLTVDGIEVHGVSGLLMVDDANLLDDLADRVIATQQP